MAVPTCAVGVLARTWGSGRTVGSIMGNLGGMTREVVPDPKGSQTAIPRPKRPCVGIEPALFWVVTLEC